MLLRRMNPMRVMAVGMLLVAAGSISVRHHVPGMSPDLADALSGFLYGSGLALMILVVVLKGRRGRGRDTAGPHA